MGAAARPWERGSTCSRHRGLGGGARARSPTKDSLTPPPTAPPTKSRLLGLRGGGGGKKGERVLLALQPRGAACGGRSVYDRAAPCGSHGMEGWGQRPAVSLLALHPAPPPVLLTERTALPTSLKWGDSRMSRKHFQWDLHAITWKRSLQPPCRRALLALLRPPRPLPPRSPPSRAHSAGGPAAFDAPSRAPA